MKLRFPIGQISGGHYDSPHQVIQYLHRQNLTDQYNWKHPGIVNSWVFVSGLLDGKVEGGGLAANHSIQEV